MVHHHGLIRRYRILIGILLGVMLLGLCASGELAADPTITVVNITTTAYMGVPLLTVSSATNITDTSAILHGYITTIGGSNITCRGFEWGYYTGNYTMSWNETGAFETGAFNHTINTLLPDWQVFFRAFAVNIQGQGNSTELSFTTVTLPSAPTNFIVTEIENTYATITWTVGTRTNTTIIRGSTTSYPRTIADGYLVYSGGETKITVQGLDLNTATYYYRAWSQNEYGYSLGYAQDYAGNPIGLPSLIFVVGLCGFALWKKDWARVLLAVSIITWGAFAIQYDVKIAAPLLTLGTILFFMGLTRIIQARREEEV